MPRPSGEFESLQRGSPLGRPRQKGMGSSPPPPELPPPRVRRRSRRPRPSIDRRGAAGFRSIARRIGTAAHSRRHSPSPVPPRNSRLSTTTLCFDRFPPPFLSSHWSNCSRPSMYSGSPFLTYCVIRSARFRLVSGRLNASQSMYSGFGSFSHCPVCGFFSAAADREPELDDRAAAVRECPGLLRGCRSTGRSTSPCSVSP